MKPSQIIVGKIYRNKGHPGALYLGVGRAGNGAGFTEKRLVVIQSSANETRFTVGRTAVTYNENPGYWNNFYLTKQKLVIV